MLIGELSERTGLSRDTIRFYEKKGLISIPEKLRKRNHYKDYSEQIFNKLQLIITLKNLGFTLNETASFLRSWEDDETSCGDQVHNLHNKLPQIDSQIRHLNQIKERLSNSLKECGTNNCEFEKAIPSTVN